MFLVVRHNTHIQYQGNQSVTGSRKQACQEYTSHVIKRISCDQENPLCDQGTSHVVKRISCDQENPLCDQETSHVINRIRYAIKELNVQL